MIDKLAPFVIPGVLYGLATLGLALIYRYCRFPDLTVLGSITIGGLSASAITASTDSAYWGLAVGSVSGAFLGLLTGVQACHLRIQPVLAGIITLTASISFGYWLAPKGEIEIPAHLRESLLLSDHFTVLDLFVASSIVLAVCILLAFIMKTRFGSLVLALTGDKQYVCARHRFRGRTFLKLTTLGNALVGFAGALFAMKNGGAHVVAHQSFLPFGLGAIFGGNAIAILLSKLAGEDSNEPNAGLLRRMAASFRPDRDDSERMVLLCLSYVIGCLCLQLLEGAVQSEAFKEISPWLSVPPTSRHFIIAILMALSVWWASKEEDHAL